MQVTGLTPSSFEKTSASKNNMTPAEAQEQFSTFLKNSIEEVNAAQIQSDKITEKMVRGEQVDLHTVMITSQKASVMLQTTLEIRNKAVEAYQEIMRMQV